MVIPELWPFSPARPLPNPKSTFLPSLIDMLNRGSPDFPTLPSLAAISHPTSWIIFFFFITSPLFAGTVPNLSQPISPHLLLHQQPPASPQVSAVWEAQEWGRNYQTCHLDLTWVFNFSVSWFSHWSNTDNKGTCLIRLLWRSNQFMDIKDLARCWQTMKNP